MKRLNLRYIHIQKREELYNIWDLLRDLEGGKLSDGDLFICVCKSIHNKKLQKKDLSTWRASLIEVLWMSFTQIPMS